MHLSLATNLSQWLFRLFPRWKRTCFSVNLHSKTNFTFRIIPRMQVCYPLKPCVTQEDLVDNVTVTHRASRVTPPDFLSSFFVKKIPLSRRVEYVMDGSTDQWVSEWVSESVSERCMSHQSDRMYYKQPIKILVLKANVIWEDLIPIQFRKGIFILL